MIEILFEDLARFAAMQEALEAACERHLIETHGSKPRGFTGMDAITVDLDAEQVHYAWSTYRYGDTAEEEDGYLPFQYLFNHDAWLAERERERQEFEAQQEADRARAARDIEQIRRKAAVQLIPKEFREWLKTEKNIEDPDSLSHRALRRLTLEWAREVE